MCISVHNKLSACATLVKIPFLCEEVSRVSVQTSCTLLTYWCSKLDKSVESLLVSLYVLNSKLHDQGH